MERYYLGVGWADKFHQVWVGNSDGKKVMEKKVIENVESLSEFGRWLDEQRASRSIFGQPSRASATDCGLFFWTLAWWFIRSILKLWIEPVTDFV